MPKYSKNYYKKFIQINKVDELLETLLEDLSLYLSSKPDATIQRIYDAFIIQAGRWKSLNQTKILGIGDDRDNTKKEAQISNDIMSNINSIPAYFFKFMNGETPVIHSSPTMDLRNQIVEISKNTSFEYDAFFSFSSKDLEQAKTICDELRGYGLKVFLTDEALKAEIGSSFQEKIEYALRNSRCFFLLSTQNAMKSEWVRTEYETFYSEFYVKNKDVRKFIIIKGQNFSINDVPLIYRRLQLANNPKEILNTLIKDEAFKKKRAAEAQKKQEKEQDRLALLAGQKQAELDRQDTLKRQAEREELERQALAEYNKQKAADEKAWKKKAAAEKRALFIKMHGWKMGVALVTLLLVLFGYRMCNVDPIDNDLPDSNAIDIVDTDTDKEDIKPPPSPPQNNILASIESNMKYISGGSYTMGCKDGRDSDCDDDEKPPHSVTVSSFKISKYEVTQEQWREVMGTNPSYFKNCDKCPVEKVSWNDTQDFLKKLNQKTGKNYRLPTEVEWEYAARGGQNYPYAGSNTVGNVAWYDGNSNSKTHPVGGKSPNGYGLYDMTGNVREWCQDWKKGYPGSSGVKDYTGSGRVFRGGSWNIIARRCRVSFRDNYDPSYRYIDYGFRVVSSQ